MNGLATLARCCTLLIMNIARISTLGLATIILWALGYALWLTNFVFEPLPFQLDHSLRGIAVFALGAMMSLGIGRLLNRLQARADARIDKVVVAARYSPPPRAGFF